MQSLVTHIFVAKDFFMASIQYSLNMYGEAISEIVQEELAHAADLAYTDSGESLYDDVVLTSKDDDVVKRLMRDALNRLARESSDVLGANSTAGALAFDLPDFVGTNDILKSIDRYIMLYTCAGIFNSRIPAKGPEYLSRAEEALQNIITLMRTRQAPTRQ